MEMRRSFKIIIILMIISAILCSSASTALAISDNALWEDAELCPFLEAGEESNSDLCFAAVKVKYDRSINRIYLLFTLEFNEFNNIESCGVIMNFNGMGNMRYFLIMLMAMEIFLQDIKIVISASHQRTTDDV